MFSALDLLLGLAGLAVPAAITLASWLLVATGSRAEETPRAAQAQADLPVVSAGNMHTVAAEPILESR
jgi:hypothetical protein